MKAKHLCSVLALLWICVACGREVKIVEVDPMNIDFSSLTQSAVVKPRALEMHGDPIPAVVFTFSSENEAVAAVDSDGTVKPVGNGSSAIIAKAPNGVQGESFVRVCLPKELVCSPKDKLVIRAGIAAPIQCHVTNCRDDEIPASVEMSAADTSVVLKEQENVFIGLKVGDTEVTAKAFNMQTKVAIHVDEQEFLPGEGGGSDEKSTPKKGAGKKGSSDPYGSGGGRFDHILKNMKVSGN